MRPYRLALLLSTALLAHAGAHAGDVTLFSGADMTGRETRVSGDVGSLRSAGFNDRAQSLVVHSGRWEACVDADFRGECRIFDAGPHRNLDRFTNQISSLRQIDDRQEREHSNRRGGGRGNGDQSVMLFDGADLRGRSVALRGDTNDLVPLGFNDRTESMVIRGGTWEFCQHSDFRDQCRVFGPGEYRNLDRSFQRAISSARQVGGDGRGQRGERGPRDDYGQRGGDGVDLFAGPGFGGQRIPVRDQLRTLEEINFNDRAGSLVVHSGQWEFCQHADFRGQCAVYGPGRYDRLGTLHNAISSMRRVR